MERVFAELSNKNMKLPQRFVQLNKNLKGAKTQETDGKTSKVSEEARLQKKSS